MKQTAFDCVGSALVVNVVCEGGDVAGVNKFSVVADVKADGIAVARVGGEGLAVGTTAEDGEVPGVSAVAGGDMADFAGKIETGKFANGDDFVGGKIFGEGSFALDNCFGTLGFGDVALDDES